MIEAPTDNPPAWGRSAGTTAAWGRPDTAGTVPHRPDTAGTVPHRPDGEMPLAGPAAASGAGDPLESARHWELALQADHEGNAPRCLHHCLVVLMSQPNRRHAQLLGAAAARQVQDWRLAAALLGQVLDSGEIEPGRLDWQRIVASTFAGDTEGLARSVARLGLDPSAWTDGETLVVVELDGQNLVGRLCGPVEAEILTISPVGWPQHVGDVVVIDPLSGSEQRSDEGEALLGRVRGIAVTRKGTDRVITLYGVDPGEDNWHAVGTLLAARGWTMRRCHGDNAPLGVIRVPSQIDQAQAVASLGRLTADWPRPLAYMA